VTNRDGRVGDTSDDRWHGRPALSILLKVAIFATPIALSIVAATITAHVLPRPHQTAEWVGWWVVVLGVPTVVLVATDRVARRALPLAILLKMTMVFPDRAPRRLAVARKSGSTRTLARRVEEARTHGVEDEPVRAAEKILALAGALNAHDRLTRGHGERVRAYTDLIADELNLRSDDRDRLRWSALLHDIGKLAVHPHILNKPGKLNDDEWAIIKKHPLEGAKLTAPLAGWLGPWANTIAEHHEKYDGTGYPYGLKGEEISLGGRIVAVADCYDVMTAVRTYQRPVSAEAARAELAACAGSQFDPKVVRAFLDVSIGRLRPVAGPLAWLGSLPFVGSGAQLGQAAATLGRVAAATVTAAGAVTAGALHAAAQATALPHPDHRALPTGTGHRASGAGGAEDGVGGTSREGTGKAAGSVDTGKGSAGSSTGTTVAGPSGSGLGGSGNGGSGNGGSGNGTTTVPTTVPGARPTVPAAPTVESAVAGNGDVTVSWSTPNNGGNPIVSYTVRPYIGGVAQAPHSFMSTATSQIVTGLTNGDTYTFTVTAINAVGPSPPSGSSPSVTPIAATLTIVNGGAQAGQAQQGDQIIVTFSPAPSPTAFCGAWSSTSSPDLIDPSVVVQGVQPSSGDDTVTVTDSADCSGGFHFGTIDLGQRGYFAGTATFGGLITGGGPHCNPGQTAACSRIHWNGQNTLTITLGLESSGQPTQASTSVAVYTPDPALGLSGTIDSVKEENF